ncbi:hypothetical protein N656DRAFT_797686 [Canariomyces notabilis]|uniref:Uncharacterized protein n=1 Tax=Canariomyces notabilis TaxID=2074819 RepID=A0AAN6TEW0_9PEZI|nr:hypothetical protein N656DRAFT_797686 [Canariomyces arenarius]
MAEGSWQIDALNKKRRLCFDQASGSNDESVPLGQQAPFGIPQISDYQQSSWSYTSYMSEPSPYLTNTSYQTYEHSSYELNTLYVPEPSSYSSKTSHIHVPEPSRVFRDNILTATEGEGAFVHQKRHIPEVVCFGKIVRIAGTCHNSLPTTSRYPAHFDSPNAFRVTIGGSDDTLLGTVDSEHAFLIADLLGENELELEVSVSSKEDGQASKKRSRPQAFLSSTKPCLLDIVLYGPLQLFQDIGSYLQDHEFYLQDPVGCKRHVRYCNPHRLPPLDAEVMVFTSTLAVQQAHAVEMQNIGQRPDLLEVLDSQHDLEEAAQPPAVKTILEKHQKKALTFMLLREQGWAWDGSRPDIWEAQENGPQQFCFINRVSDTIQDDQPPQFYGGIIADPMGMGKTLSMISLIASDIRSDDSEDIHPPWRDDREPCPQQTLVVVPPPLLGTWEEELTEHLFPHSLNWCRHHGKSRLVDLSQLHSTRLILTTYHTVAMEWKNKAKNDASLLFKTRWRRVVLDEAHFIRNSGSQMARAICELDSVARWAVTGTPIQNRLGDLATLLKFLKVHPYAEKAAFDTDIVNPWKSGNDKEAVKRLKRLAGCLLLRRSKGIISLPARHDLKSPVELSCAERELYESIRTQAQSQIDEALVESSYSLKPHSFVNVLQQIEAMRIVCNLGLHYHTRQAIEAKLQINTDDSNWNRLAQRAFDVCRGLGQLQCCLCSSNLDDMGEELGDHGDQAGCRPLFSQCLKFVCQTCAPQFSGRKRKAFCGCEASCSFAAVSPSPAAADFLEGSTFVPDKTQSGLGGSGQLVLSSKVAMLLEDIRQHVHETSDVKCVVFSTWRMTLDLVEAGLKQAGMACLRFDGKVPQKERQGVVKRFQTDPTVKILLLTLSCGAVGITLTAASRAYLMEPHWNPTLEDQALARIHRMGQRREVTTVRFVVKDSFEERVIETQDSKRDLAGILLNPQNHGLSGKPLEWLRALI